MTSRSSTTSVTFRSAFTLAGLDGIQPPGTYAIHTEEEMLDTLSLTGWRQTGCTIAIQRDGGEEHVAVDSQDLREALVRDGGQSTDPPTAPAVAIGRGRRPRDQLRRGGRS